MAKQHSALVIDDKPIWRRSLARPLQALGFAVETAGSYALAKTLIESRAARREPFDLALVDLLLGDADIYCGAGFALIERLLDLDTAVVIVSGWATPELVDQVFKTFGFLGFLEKQNLTPEVLEQVVQTVTSKRGSSDEPMDYNLGAIGELVEEAFSPAELRRLCQDRPELAPATREFAENGSLRRITLDLVQYCQRMLLFPELLEAIRQQNPRQYARYRPRLHRADGPASQPGRRLSSADRQELERLLRTVATGHATPPASQPLLADADLEENEKGTGQD